MLRHLPPTAAPIRMEDLLFGLFTTEFGDQHLKKFESALVGFFDVARAYAVDSGRTALRIILEMIKSNPTKQDSPQVIVPAYTCPVLVKVIQDAGLIPVLCDMEPENFDYDEDQLLRLASENTLAVIHIHPFGLPRLNQAVVKITNEVGAILIDDACQAIGAEINGVKVGGFGTFGFASFGPGKPLNLGGGGVLLVNDLQSIDLAEITKLDQKRSPSLSNAKWLDSVTAWMRIAVSNQLFRPFGWWLATRFGLHHLGNNPRSWGYRMQWMTGIQAEIGMRSLKYSDKMNANRQFVGQSLASNLSDHPGIQILSLPPGIKPIYLRFPFYVLDRDKRDDLFQLLWSAGIGVGKMYQKPLKDFFPELSGSSFPGATYIAQHLLTLPTHSFMKTKDLETIIAILNKV